MAQTAAAQRTAYTQTVAATKRRQELKTQKLASEIGDRLDQLNDEWLCALARAVMAEVAVREATQPR